VVSLAVGIAMALLGLAIPAVHFLYSYAWFVGFGAAAALYVILMKREVSL
jgi:NCS1 family nucleobase:cation symporter-1